MPKFTPTIEFAFTDKVSEEAQKQLDDLAASFAGISLDQGITFGASPLRIVGTDTIITNYRSIIEAVYEIDGVTHLKLQSGDIIAIHDPHLK